MAKNIEMNLKDSSGVYEILYPKTLGSLIDGKVSSASSADSATSATTATSAGKLSTGRTIQTNLNSTNSVSFDGSSNISPGVTGTLPIGNGGTNGTSASNALYNLISGCGTRSSSQVNSYASNTYLGAYYSSTGYRIPISNLLTYIQNNISSGVKFYNGTMIMTQNITVTVGFKPKLIIGNSSYSATVSEVKGLGVHFLGSLVNDNSSEYIPAICWLDPNVNTVNSIGNATKYYGYIQGTVSSTGFSLNTITYAMANFFVGRTMSIIAIG